MKLYKEYKKIIETIHKKDKIKKAYFTTFNISPEFVERYIIPPLYQKEIPTTELHYEDINKAIESSKLDLRFFYDANMLQFDESKRTIAHFHPVSLQNGVFHPKVIYLEGENTFYLFVGSGNLTLNGWGRNIEAFRVVEFNKNDNLYNEVGNFFVDVFRVAKMKDTASGKKKTVISTRNFVYGFDKKSNFIEHLNLGRYLQVWSPYFSDLDELLAKDQFGSLEEIRIIPDLKSGLKSRLDKKPEDSRISFYREKESGEPVNRFNHSKVWLSDTKIAIGSYNMTQQAIDGVNFEAALVEDIGKNSDFFRLDGEPFEVEICEENEAELDEDALHDERYRGFYTLEANWKTRTLTIEELVSSDNKHKIVVLPGGVQVEVKELAKLDTIQTTAVFRALSRNKIFTILGANEKVLFRGVIQEKECKGYRDTLKAESLEDIFDFFADDSKPENLERKLEERMLHQSIESGNSYEGQVESPFQKNYFTMFKGFKSLHEELQTIKSNDKKKLHQFCFSSTVSLNTIMYILEQAKEQQEKSLFLYLCIEELNMLIAQANKLLKDYKDFPELQEMKNIDLQLTKEDKNFLKAYQNV